MTGDMPAWALARASSEPTACVCCERPFTRAGADAEHHAEGLGDGRWIAWCRRCDPWRDAARGVRHDGERVRYGPMLNLDGVCQHAA